MSAPDILPPRPSATRAVRVECLSCGRVAALDGSRVRDAPLVQLTRHLRCSACGSGAVRADRIDAPRDVDTPREEVSRPRGKIDRSREEVDTPRDVAKLLRARMDTDRG